MRHNRTSTRAPGRLAARIASGRCYRTAAPTADTREALEDVRALAATHRACTLESSDAIDDVIMLAATREAR